MSILNLKEEICSAKRFPMCCGANSPDSSCRQIYLQVGRPGKSGPVRQEVRLDNADHFPRIIAYPMRFIYFGGNVRKKYRKYSKSLHLNFCFQAYNQEEKL